MVEGAEHIVGSGEVLPYGVTDQLIDYARETEGYDEVSGVLAQNLRNKSEIEPIDATKAYVFEVYAEDNGFDTPELDGALNDYFAEFELSEGQMSDLSEGLPESIPANKTDEVMRDRREKIRDAAIGAFDIDVDDEEEMTQLNTVISRQQGEYLSLLRDRDIVEPQYTT